MGEGEIYGLEIPRGLPHKYLYNFTISQLRTALTGSAKAVLESAVT